MNAHLQQPAKAMFSRAVQWRGILASNAAKIALIFAALPLIGGAMFRWYGFASPMDWYEALRQFDFPDIVAALLVIFWARERGMKLPKMLALLDRPARIALAIFIMTFAVGAVISAPQPGYSILRALYWLVHITFGFSLFYLLQQVTSQQIEKFGRFLVFGLVLFIPVIAIHFALAPASSITGEPVKWSSSIPGYRSVREFGFLSGYVAAFWIGLTFWRHGKNAAGWQSWAVLTFLLAVLFWTGTRGAFVGCAAAALFAAISLRRLPTIKTMIAGVASAAAAVAISTPFLPPSKSFGFFRPHRISSDVETLSSGRMAIWRESIDLTWQRPLFGWGEGSYRWLSELPSTMNHLQPHNAILQFFLSFGVIAALAAFYLAGRIVWTLHRDVRRVPAMLAPLMMLDCLLVTSMFDGVLFYSRTLMATGAATALCYALSCQADAAKTKPAAGPKAS